jgi:hypothetical protein
MIDGFGEVHCGHGLGAQWLGAVHLSHSFSVPELHFITGRQG